MRIVILLVAGMLMACGGGGGGAAPEVGEDTRRLAPQEPVDQDDLLRLPDGNYSEDDIRQVTRIYIGDDPAYYCAGYLDVETDAGLIEYEKRGYLQSEEAEFNDHIRLVSEVDDADFLRSAEITREECAAAN